MREPNLYAVSSSTALQPSVRSVHTQIPAFSTGTNVVSWNGPIANPRSAALTGFTAAVRMKIRPFESTFFL